MAELKVIDDKKKTPKKNYPRRAFVFAQEEEQLLKRVGLKIHRDLFAKKKAVEALAYELGIARSTLREIIAGRSNARILTLNAIAIGLGYSSLVDFLRDI